MGAERSGSKLTQHTRHVPRVISEEDTTKGGKDTEKVRLDGDRSFHPVRVARSCQNSTAGHSVSDQRQVDGVCDGYDVGGGECRFGVWQITHVV